ncbi:MAG: helix-turn-helix transcriptional regulator [Burkholderiales bacterium]
MSLPLDSLQSHAPAAPRHELGPVGELIRGWRTTRRLSQMALALDVSISPRHLSFLETGRSLPSRRVLLLLAERLDVPLRLRNAWLLAAGYAPGYSELPLDSDRLAPVREALQRLLEAHSPYPGLVVDRAWHIVMANPAAQALVSLLPPALAQAPINLFRISLHPEGLAAHTSNFDDWGRYLLHELQQLAAASADPALHALLQEVQAYPNIAALLRQPTDPAVTAPLMILPFKLRLGAQELSFFTTLARIGTPRDVTLDELCIELFYPSDDATRRWLQASA